MRVYVVGGEEKEITYSNILSFGGVGFLFFRIHWGLLVGEVLFINKAFFLFSLSSVSLQSIGSFIYIPRIPSCCWSLILFH